MVKEEEEEEGGGIVGFILFFFFLNFILPLFLPAAMNPNCARCGKIVYPTEKVNCLDKVSPPGATRGHCDGNLGFFL